MTTLPRIADDGAARHLKKGMRVPDIALPSTAGRSISLATQPGLVIAFVYPWTGRPGVPNPPNWDDIPGAHGSTPQAEGFRNLAKALEELNATVFGISGQDTAWQREFADRAKLDFELLSDQGFALQKALSLPTFETGGVAYLKRLTIALIDGRIARVYYPIAHPAAHAREICAWLGMADKKL